MIFSSVAFRTKMSRFVFPFQWSLSFYKDSIKTHWGRVTHICVGKPTSSVQIMAWSAPNHNLNQCWNTINSKLKNKLQWNFNRNAYVIIHGNAFESVVCVLAAILSRPQCLSLHIIGSGNCVPSNWWHATTWFNEDIIPRLEVALLGHNEWIVESIKHDY